MAAENLRRLDGPAMAEFLGGPIEILRAAARL
jgi:hypothetical protein